VLLVLRKGFIKQLFRASVNFLARGLLVGNDFILYSEYTVGQLLSVTPLGNYAQSKTATWNLWVRFSLLDPVRIRLGQIFRTVHLRRLLTAVEEKAVLSCWCTKTCFTFRVAAHCFASRAERLRRTPCFLWAVKNGSPIWENAVAWGFNRTLFVFCKGTGAIWWERLYVRWALSEFEVLVHKD